MKEGWFEDNFGNKRHYVDDRLHSVNDEPAVIFSSGSKAWHKEGELHRELGPAWIYSDGHKEYYFQSKHYPEITSDLEWLMKVEELKKELDIDS